MLVVTNPAHVRHDPAVELEQSGSHPPLEQPERAERIRAALAADARFELQEPTAHGTEVIAAVHDPGLVRFLETAWREYQDAFGATREVFPDVFFPAGLRAGMEPGREPEHIGGRLGWWSFETTTPLVEGTYLAARGAADAALTAAERVLAGRRSAYALCRPPGHHAAHGVYGGYCFFNNAALAASALAGPGGAKVAVLDVDYHHGNGTQQIFYARGDVLFVSLHGDPRRAYPYGLGHEDERGAGRGLGANVNLPLAVGTGDREYLAALATACEHIARFGAEALVVSLGVDTAASDPIGDLGLGADGFGASGALVGELGLPTVVVQEGGYDLGTIGEHVHAWLVGLDAAQGSGLQRQQGVGRLGEV